MATLEFFYDFISPYSYLASVRVEAIAARTGATLRWRPFLLGAVHKAKGVIAPYLVEAKQRYMLDDLDRWARRLGVGLHWPEPFPFSPILALRAGLAAEAAGQLVPYTHAVYRARWADRRDIADPAVLTAVLTEAGLDGAALVAAAPNFKEALTRQTQEAIDRGAFGAPACFVGDELFIGNDRLDFVEEALSAASRRA
jgi:2-hydroxychromene-2-carboxylate isomerase